MTRTAPMSYRCVWLLTFWMAALATVHETRRTQAGHGPAASVSSSYELPETRGVAAKPQPAAKAAEPAAGSDTAVCIQCRVKGTDGPMYLPVVADTYVTNNSRRANGAGRQIAIRDNRYCQALLRFGTEGLPREAQITSATLRLKVERIERQADFTLRFHRMLTPWNEGQATWFEPAENAEPWNGLRPGKDYEAKAFAELKSKAVTPGTTLEVEGFGPLVQSHAGGQPNHGLLVLLFGAAIQANIPSRETMYRIPDATETLLTLGGSSDNRVLLDLNLPLVRRGVLESADLQRAELCIVVHALPAKQAQAQVEISRLADSPPNQEGLPGTIGGPIMTLAPDKLKSIPLEGVLREALASGQENVRLMLRLISPDGSPAELAVYPATHRWRSRRPVMKLELKARTPEQLFAPTVVPREGTYVQARDGHLDYGGRRLRLWGVCRHATDAFNLGRLRRMGFNAIRLWGDHDFYDAASARAGLLRNYAQGDGSGFDKFDQAVHECKRQGLWIVCPSLHYISKHLRKGVVEDGSFVSGGDDWPQWRQSMQEKGAEIQFLKYFDERCRKIYFQHARNFLEHVNPYTGRRYAEEEAFACFELGNEVGMLKWSLERGFDGWPSYFRDQLRRRWNDWLRNKYLDDQRLAAAWGKLAPEESLARQTIALAPIYTQRNEYPAARARDFLRFLVGLVETFHAELRDFCRRQAPPDAGARVIPFLFDTQYRFNLPWQYTNAQADVMSFGMYINSLTSSLTVPPGVYVVDSTSIRNKPTILYEVNQNRPCPYRAEFPLKLATLASWQDWDGVFWHYWDSSLRADEEFPLAAMPYPRGAWSDGCIYHSKDPVMTSALALAGQLFLGDLIRPAPNPTIFRVGRDAPFRYQWFNGVSMRSEAFRRGAHVEFDPSQEEDLTIVGESPNRPSGQAIAAGTEILWDWPNGRLIVDAPRAKIYVGPPVAAHRFRDGIVLSGAETSFMAFALVGLDGKPLAGPEGSRRMATNAVFDARNSRFVMDLSIAKAGGGFVGPADQSAAIRSEGHAPVVVDKVCYRLAFPQNLRGRLRQYDFALRRYQETPIEDTNLVRVGDHGNRWMSVVEVDARGRAVDTALAPELARAGPATTRPAAQPDAWPEAGSSWCPIDGLNWSMSYDQAHQYLRESTLGFSSLGRNDPSSGLIVLSDCEAVLRAAANIEIRFQDGRMGRISAAFTKAPPLEQAAADLTAKLGKPTSSKFARQAFEESLCVWEAAQPGGLLLVVKLKEFQGTMGAEFVLKKRP